MVVIRRAITLVGSLLPFLLAFLGIALPVIYLSGAASAGAPGVHPAESTLRVLSYSAFLESWGPGPELARRFAAQTGIEIQYLDAGDAGLLLKKLELFPADVVVGIDGLSLAQARSARSWRDPGFAAYDWAPMAFIYREGEIEPPRSLADLLDARFRGAIAIEDPRTSTPGLQLFLWLMDEFGVDGGFAFLEKLRPNLQSVGASWSQAYGAFTKKRARLAFSYATSPVYHWTEEHKSEYRAASLAEEAPAQTEYAAIPSDGENPAGAARFVQFLLEPEAQRLLMEKNFMFPVDARAADGTPFGPLLAASKKTRAWKDSPRAARPSR